MDATVKLLSLCMIVRNESGQLARCLKSIQSIADEIIVVDTGSIDATVSIAQQYGAVVIREPWQDDFSHARNLSLKHATGRWILWLDADDEIPPESVARISQLKNMEPDRIFAFVIRNSRHDTGCTEFVQVRMFPRHPAIRFERRIHEEVVSSAVKKGFLVQRENKAIVEHHGYYDPSVRVCKARRNIDLLLLDIRDRGCDPVNALEIAEAYEVTGNLEESGFWYHRVIQYPRVCKEYPVLASQAYLHTADHCIRQERFAEALVHLDKSLETAPGRLDALYGVAVVKSFLGKTGESIELLKRILHADRVTLLEVPVDLQSVVIKAFCLLEQLVRHTQRFAEAWDAAPLILSIAPESAEVHAALGGMLFREQRYGDALRAFDKCIMVSPGACIDGHIGRAFSLVCLQQHEEAIALVVKMRALFSAAPAFHAFHALFIEGRNSMPEVPAGVAGRDMQRAFDDIRSRFGLEEQRAELVTAWCERAVA